MDFSSALAFAALILNPSPSKAIYSGDLSTIHTSISEIRVHVFPHLRNDLPQMRDKKSDHAKLSLKGDGTCHVFEGTLDHPGKGANELESGTDFDFSKANLPSPRWVECDSAVTVVRAAGLPEFSYSGAMYVHLTSSGKSVEVENVLSLDDYLKGVVPGEMPAHWPAEALKAQAVAARTYSVYHALAGRSDTDLTSHPMFDVDDTDFYQVYTGATELDDRSSAAVDATSGEILIYQGKVIQAYFHADSGGYTEDAANVWPVDAPYCLGKKEIFGYSDETIFHELGGAWAVPLDFDALNDHLVADGLVDESNPLTAASVEERFPSGRAKTVTLDLDDGSETKIDAQIFRRDLGLRSTMFDFAPASGDAWQVEGRGWGHGVGLNQDGAKILSENFGWDYRRILGFYYTAVELVNGSSP